MGPFQRNDVRPSAMAVEAGIDHVRLLYDYLDRGDLAGYGSLLDARVRIQHADATVTDGRAAAGEAADRLPALHGSHRIHRILRDSDTIVVTGRFIRSHTSATDTRTPPAVEFADFFLISRDGLLLSWHRYHARAT
ncbi:hypothetical protein H4W79_000155 [Nocardiopsis terrae]|uniref:SnoaL-like domain-containing protein n=1 Tax=Nocardiopsis terrae TaxID=372655 RepID=A0ABR9HA94_9ACTN|nr:nuclear transport factor 2 family protein [Nocardiopsis terrae]MBE1455941.1 hypothetical protein [Nocardiopsis terrae]